MTSGTTPWKRRPVATPLDPRDKQITELQRTVRKSEARADRAVRSSSISVHAVARALDLS